MNAVALTHTHLIDGPSVHDHGHFLDGPDTERAKMEPLSAILDRARFRAAHRTTLDIDKVSDLNIRHFNQDGSHSKDGYYARIGSQDMRLSDVAMKQANKLIRVRDQNYWSQFPDDDAFPKTLSHILDNKKNPNIRVRHDGLEINSIALPNYQFRDAVETLDDIVPAIEEFMGAIQFVSAIEEGSGDVLSYRFVVGGNIMPGVKDEYGQYMCFMVNTSETGAIDSGTVLGSFRTICTNAAVRVQTGAKWNHRGDLDSFLEKTGNNLRQTAHYRNSFANIFGELMRNGVGMPMSDLMAQMAGVKLITRGHYDVVKTMVNGQTEDGREHTTQYDAFNLLTNAAQGLPSTRLRFDAEQRAMKIFHRQGGLKAALIEAEEKNGHVDLGDDDDE